MFCIGVMKKQIKIQLGIFVVYSDFHDAVDDTYNQERNVFKYLTLSHIQTLSDRSAADEF